MSFLKSFFKSVLISFIVAALLTTLVGGTVYTRIQGMEADVSELEIDPQPTTIYDKDGNELAHFKKETKDVTSYEEIPIEVIEAVTAIEDRDFYKHPGINVKAITRAAVAIFKADGAIVQGGSTITQQLIKETYLTKDQNLDRKVREAVLATSLEQQVSKDEIITNYLNHIFYGNNAYGIRSAIDTYFGQTLDGFKKDERIVRIAKAAFLAGLPQAPSLHNPYLYPDSAKQRRDAVLAAMWTVGYINEKEYKQAKDLPFLVLNEPKIKYSDEIVKYGEIITYVLKEMAEKLGTTVEEAKYSGYEVHTSFDPKAYEIIRKHYADDSLFPKNSSNGEPIQSTMSIVNPKNGEIIAMTGGREAPKYADLNRAFQGKRQPGSSFKPIIDYAPAIESGKFNPWSVLVDQPGYVFPGGYSPKNFSGRGNGSMLMVDALKVSQNIPAVYLLHKTGIDYATNFAKRFGFTFAPEEKYLPIALGGLHTGVSTLQMADAYQGFANGGYRVPAHIVKRMVNSEGEVVYEAPNELSESYRVMKPQTAEYMRYMLQNAVISGTGSQAQIKGELVGGKTGTTDDTKDVWFTGFTNAFTASVWMGYDNPESINGGSYIPAKMFAVIGKDLAKYYPDGDVKFTTPKKIKTKVEKIKITANYNEKSKSVSINWDSKKDTKFSLYKNNKIILTDFDKNSYVDTEIEEGKVYEYSVIGTNEFTKFDNFISNKISVQIPFPPVPPKSTSFTSSEVTEESVSLTWSEVPGADTYILTKDGVTIYEGKKLSFVENGLNPKTLYHFEVFAKNQYGNSSPEAINLTTKESTIKETIIDDFESSDLPTDINENVDNNNNTNEEETVTQ